MPIPIFLPVVWAAVKVIAATGFIKSTLWGGTRFVQHGFDTKATKEQLRADMVAGKILARDAASLLKSMHQLARAGTAASICEAAAHISAALSHLPNETRVGLDNSVDLSNRINSMLESALKRAHTELPDTPREKLLPELTRRHLEKVIK